MTRSTFLALALATLVAGCGGKPAEPQRFVIYFETGSVTLTREAKAIADAAAAAVREHGSGKVTVEGHADGGTTNDAELADKRALAVIAALTGDGVEAARIEKIQGVPTAGLTGVGAHQVLITLVP
jgi:outer membrane protein OmpA-like peptidoglycan-associated protein